MPPQRPPAISPQLCPNYPPQNRRDRQEDLQYFRQQDQRRDRRPARCFLCDEEGHFAYRCPTRTLLQRLLRQQTPEQARRPPSSQVFKLPPANGSPNTPPVQLNLTEESPGAKVAPVKCAVAPPISGHPSQGTGGHRSLSNLSWLRHLVALPRPMGGTGAVYQCCAWCTR